MMLCIYPVDCKNSYKFKTEGGKIKSKELAKSYASKKLSSHDLVCM